MKSKPINAADSNNASELSDAALLDILGGCTEYADIAVTVQVTDAQMAGALNAGKGTEAPHTPPTGPAGTTTPLETKPVVSPHDQPAGPATPASKPVVSPHDQPAGPATPASKPVVSPHDQPAGPATPASTAGNHDPQTKPPTNTDRDHDHDHSHVREAFEAAHERFHEAMDEAHDGIEHILEGAAEIAVAAIELNPVVAGLHILHDLRGHHGKGK